MKKISALLIILLTYPLFIISQSSDTCECDPPCISLKECPGNAMAPRKDCPCCHVCLQQEDKFCEEPHLPCDKKAGLICTPSPKGLCQVCGRNNRYDPFLQRIEGGHATAPKDWPWMAGLLKSYDRRRSFCGGTLITDRHVLTAAHCLSNIPLEDLIIRLGEHDFNDTTDNDPRDFEVEQKILHEEYKSNPEINDIGIVKLRTFVDFNEYIWSACLPPPNEDFNDQLGLVAGWGQKYYLGPSHLKLQELPIKVWNQSACVKAYENNTILDSMMCSGWADAGRDSCPGDSGGPFVIQPKGQRRWEVVGIVSWGKQCGNRNQPGVYTRVNYYLNWIEINTQISYKPSPKPPSTIPTGESPLDCSEVCPPRRICPTGVYKIYPIKNREVEVLCDMDTDGGGWTVLVNRMNHTPQEDFNRGWDGYKEGFGNASAEYWIGNENMFLMTKAKNYTLRIEAKAKDLEDSWGEFAKFKVASEELNYRLTLEQPIGGNMIYEGRGGWSLHNNLDFTTYDKDNDESWGNCGSLYGSGMWYSQCYNFHITGKYGLRKPSGIRFESWTTDNPVIGYADFVQMKIRPSKSKR